MSAFTLRPRCRAGSTSSRRAPCTTVSLHGQFQRNITVVHILLHAWRRTRPCYAVFHVPVILVVRCWPDKPAGDHHSPIPPAHTSRDASSSIDKQDSVVFNPGPSPIKASGRRLPSLRVVIPGLAIGPLAVHPDCRHYGFYDILNYFLMFAYLRTRRLATTIPRPESAIP